MSVKDAELFSADNMGGIEAVEPPPAVSGVCAMAAWSFTASRCEAAYTVGRIER